MATHRVSARAHPRFDRHTPPCAEDLWQTCSCESSVTGFFNISEVHPLPTVLSEQSVKRVY